MVLMIKLVLTNKFIYYGEILEETKDFLILRDTEGKILTIRQDTISVRESK